MNEDRMRALYAQHTALRALSDPPCQVSLDAMIDVLEHRGPDEARRETMAEILRSPACREEFELLRAMVRASQAVEAPVAPKPALKVAGLTPMQWRWAAGIIVVVGIGLLGLILRDRPSDQLRGGASGIAMHGPSAEQRVGSLPRFVWGRYDGAIDYRFQLLSESGQVVYSASGTDTVATLPSDVVVSTGRYLWNVTAEMPGGASVNSGTRGVVVAP
jgi:hypothetical protein